MSFMYQSNGSRRTRLGMQGLKQQNLNTLDDALVLEQSEAGFITFLIFKFFCQGQNNKYFRHVEHPDSIAMT